MILLAVKNNEAGRADGNDARERRTLGGGGLQKYSNQDYWHQLRFEADISQT
jgi:hypothetical protein